MEEQELIVRQLEAAKTALDTALLLIRAAEHGEEVCQHPENERENMSTMGHLGRWRCKRCGFTFEPEPEKEGGE
jgi:rubrerythrin